MSFADVFKKSFISGYSSTEIDTKHILAALLLTTLIAIYIFFVYRFMTRKTFYSKSFNISLAAIAVITASIILTVQSNVVVSLGMVGALSIVRFRTAIKDPMDLIFLFWAIGVGIICGAGMAEIAIITSLALTLIIYLLTVLPVAKAPMILVVNSSDINSEKIITEVVKKYSKHYKIKSRNITHGSIDLVIEVRVKDECSLIKDIATLETVTYSSLIAHDGEVTV